MTNADDNNQDLLAAEYVLGTLDANERANVAFRRGRDAELDAAIEAWTVRLAPLNERGGDAAPPPSLKEKIVAHVSGLDRHMIAAGRIGGLEARLARWRSVALGTLALAACLAGFIVVREGLRPAVQPTAYVAVLQKDAQSPAFIMSVDLVSRTFTVRPVAAAPLSGKSYELWLVSQRHAAPRSLGVIAGPATSGSALLAGFAAGDIADATYAVSLEPEGGSPTGVPTGPVVYTGKLIQTGP